MENADVLILHSDKWIGRSPFFTTKTWGPLCICESGAGVHSARGSILPGGPFCPGVHFASHRCCEAGCQTFTLGHNETNFCASQRTFHSSVDFILQVSHMACVQGRSQGGHGGHVPTPLGGNTPPLIKMSGR